jgi:hypothetical protein
LEISDFGKRLGFQPAKTASVDLKSKINGNKFLLLMDRSMSKVESTLDEMRNLALAAADSSLSIVDRLQMQIRMENLRDKLNGDTNEMSFNLAEMSGYRVRDLGVSSPSGNSALLERALDRAMKGEAWDVAERYEEEKPTIGPENEGDSLAPVTGRWVVTDDEKIPTVSQILNDSGTIVLMDEMSALRSVERIEREQKAVRGIRKEFEEFVEKLQPPPQGSEMGKDESAVLAKILEEEQTRAEALRAMLKTNGEKENSRLEALKPQLDTKKIEGDGDGEEESLKFYTELGVMEYDADRIPRLTRPANPMGEMFAKIEKLFEKIGKSLSRSLVPEGIRAD